jgi:hypothetical protein
MSTPINTPVLLFGAASAYLVYSVYRAHEDMKAVAVEPTDMGVRSGVLYGDTGHVPDGVIVREVIQVAPRKLMIVADSGVRYPIYTASGKMPDSTMKKLTFMPKV